MVLLGSFARQIGKSRKKLLPFNLQSYNNQFNAFRIKPCLQILSKYLLTCIRIGDIVAPITYMQIKQL